MQWLATWPNSLRTSLEDESAAIHSASSGRSRTSAHQASMSAWLAVPAQPLVERRREQVAEIGVLEADADGEAGPGLVGHLLRVLARHRVLEQTLECRDGQRAADQRVQCPVLRQAIERRVDRLVLEGGTLRLSLGPRSHAPKSNSWRGSGRERHPECFVAVGQRHDHEAGLVAITRRAGGLLGGCSPRDGPAQEKTRTQG